MRATKRLRVIADLVDESVNVVADIGADHGYLAKMLIEEGRAKLVIATDISGPSIEKTTKLAKKFNLSDRISTRIGDGLKPIDGETVDMIIIAGMGGYEIIKILQESSSFYKRYIFQPVQNSVQLRRYLNINNFKIVKDFMIKDHGKFYNTMLVERSERKQVLNELEIEFGLTNFDLKSDEFLEYINVNINKFSDILSKCNNDECVQEKLNLFVRAKNKILK